MSRWKRAHGLPTVNTVWKLLLVDNLKRKTVDNDPTTRMLYAIAKSLVDPPHDSISDGVVDWSHEQLINHHVRLSYNEQQPQTLSSQEQGDYVLAVLARYLFGVGDPNDQNFIRAASRVYSVDEDSSRQSPRSGGVWGALKGVSRHRVGIAKQWSKRLDIKEHVGSWSCPVMSTVEETTEFLTRLSDIREELGISGTTAAGQSF
jgi:hypothetical protein